MQNVLAPINGSPPDQAEIPALKYELPLIESGIELISESLENNCSPGMSPCIVKASLPPVSQPEAQQ